MGGGGDASIQGFHSQEGQFHIRSTAQAIIRPTWKCLLSSNCCYLLVLAFCWCENRIISVKPCDFHTSILPHLRFPLRAPPAEGWCSEGSHRVGHPQWPPRLPGDRWKQCCTSSCSERLWKHSNFRNAGSHISSTSVKPVLPFYCTAFRVTGENQQRT